MFATHLLDVSALDLMTGVDLVGTAELSPLFGFKTVRPQSPDLSSGVLQRSGAGAV